MKTPKIRRYQDSDREEVWALHNLALEAVDAHAGHGDFDDDLHHIDEVYLKGGGEFLVGVLDGRIVAMGALKRISDDHGEITRIRVLPAQWRQGHGRMILEELEHRAVEMGFTKLSLTTTTRQTAAQNLYHNMGYVKTGRGQSHGFDVIHMEKTLPARES